jgi:peptide/nickel transport system substrate-binding protein
VRSRRGRWLFLIVLLGGVAGFTALWYAAEGKSTTGEPSFGGTYVEGLTGTPARINPLFATQNEVDASLVSLVFAGLTRIDDHGTPFPDLAETWTLSPDGRVYTFRLRPGLIWQDGAELTADDVVFTYGLLKTAGSRAAPAVARILSDATVSRVDGLTVTIELPQAFAPLPSYLTLGLLPAHILRSLPPDALFDAPFNLQPIGAGPYRLEQLTAEHAVLTANPGHHLGQPFVQRIELRFYRDEGSLLAALRAKRVGGALFHTGLGEADRVEIERRTDLRETSLVTGEVSYVFLNLRLSLFQDRRVRQALLYALDRDAIVEEVFDGQAMRADSPLLPDGWAFTPALQRYGPDPKLAGLLLDEAGWRLNDRGVRARGGDQLNFTLATSADPANVAVAQAIAKRWSAIGANVTVEAGGVTALVRDMLEPRSYQTALFSLTSDADPDPYGAWHSTQASGKAGNLASLRDDRIDRVLAEARLGASPSRRRELYGEFQELFAQEVPAIPLYVATALYVQPASMRGVRLGQLTDPGRRFWQVQEWHLKTR